MTDNEKRIIDSITARKEAVNTELAGIDRSTNPTAYAITLGKSVAWGQALCAAYDVINFRVQP